LKQNIKNIERLSKPLNSDVDHLEILSSIYNKHMDSGRPHSDLIKYYLNGLDEIPTQKQKQLWNEKAIME